MEGFHENLVGIGPICDATYTVVFDDNNITIVSPTGTLVLPGWREPTGNKLWRMSLLPYAEGAQIHMDIPGVSTASLAAFSAYDLPSVEALVQYFHAAAGNPVKDTWLKAIKAGNYKSWPGLTHQNTSKYCPVPLETLKGHMFQSRQNVRSTKPKVPTVPVTVPVPGSKTNPVLTANLRVNELHICIEHISKLYIDDTD
jgi:hypothetical protein